MVTDQSDQDGRTTTRGQLTAEDHDCGAPLYRVGRDDNLFCVSCSEVVDG